MGTYALRVPASALGTYRRRRAAWPQGPAYTYWVRVPALGVGYVQRTVATQVSATAVGGTVFILVSGSLATRFKAMQPELAAVQDSFRVLAVRGRRTANG